MVMEIEVDPKRELRSFINDALKKTDNLTVPLHLIAQQWFKSNRAIFDLKGPGKYQDLSTKPFFAWWEKKDFRRYYSGGYKEYKTARWGAAYPILYRTGRLKRSITEPSDGEAVEKIINRNALELGTAVPYAVYHHSDAPRTKMPWRPVLLYGNEQVAPGALKNRIEIWQEILIDYVSQVSGAT